jgi:D-alanine-D-alanine ligase
MDLDIKVTAKVKKHGCLVAPIRKVAVLYGGNSRERQVSLVTGKAVIDALIRQNCEVDAIDWNGKESILQLIQEHYDCVFIALHGSEGEDGCVQALLELLQIPYTGSGVLASALCMDKLKTKKILRVHGIPVLPDLVLTPELDSKTIIETLGLPLCIKPNQEGSSIGVYKVHNLNELEVARADVLKYGGEIMVEPWIEGQEYTVGFLNNNPLPSIWIQAAQEFYTYDAKYVTRDTKYHCPSDLTPEQECEIQIMAKQVFNVTGCHDWARVDFIKDKNDKFYVLEMNTVPGLTGTSLVPKAAASLGISFDALVLQIMMNASLKQASNTKLPQPRQTTV